MIQVGGVAPPRRSISRAKPSCTHTVMDRRYGPFSCDSCGSPSPLGWVYTCSQDFPNDYPASPVDSVMDCHPSPEKDAPRTLKDDLQFLGFSRSIIDQAEAGLYTPAQLEVLKNQKRHVHDLIAASSTPFSLNNVFLRMDPQNPSFQSQPMGPRKPLPLVSRRYLTHASDVSPPTSPKQFPQWPCTFKCCHQCRSYLQDRCFTSFEAVFVGQVRPLNLSDTMMLPVKSAYTLRHLPDASEQARLYSGPGTCDNSTDPSRLVFNSGLRMPDMDDMTPTTASTDSFPYTEYSHDDDEDGSNQGAWEDEPTTAHHTNNQGSTFVYAKARAMASTPELSIHRPLRHVSGSIGDQSPHSLSSGSSISLPTPTTARTSPTFLDADAEHDDAGLVLGTPKLKTAASLSYNTHNIPTVGMVCSKSRYNSGGDRSFSRQSTESVGSEVEVEGGVALKEEAVGTQTPDLVTQ